jgi:hypothetical protein
VAPECGDERIERDRQHDANGDLGDRGGGRAEQPEHCTSDEESQRHERERPRRQAYLDGLDGLLDDIARALGRVRHFAERTTAGPDRPTVGK